MRTSCSGTASHLVEERVKKGRGSSPGLVTDWSHMLDLPPTGPPVYQTGQSLSKREGDSGSGCPVLATSDKPPHFPASLVIVPLPNA